MFVTPVIYSVNMVPEKWRTLYMMNPMAVVIDGMRRIILQGEPPEMQSLLIVLTAVTIFFVFAYGFFKKAEVKFADLI